MPTESEKRSLRVGVDLFGSDAPPQTLLAALEPLATDIPLTVFVTPEIAPLVPPSIHAVVAQETITMEDDPLKAVRRKKNSTLMKGLFALKDKSIDAFVSAGNTGALLFGAKTILGTLTASHRPALLTLIPTRQNELAVLDVGANLSLQPKHIVELALMGIAYQESRHVVNPKVGLLNIGREPSKGPKERKEAFSLLQEIPTFVGNVEGRDAFNGEVDVLVTDGFSGNVFLKTAEGIAQFILDELHKAAGEEASPHLKALLAKLGHRLNYDEYPGAILCGVDGLVIKCHGEGSPKALISAIRSGHRLASHAFIRELNTLFSKAKASYYPSSSR